jgi:ATP-dependent DNA helicase DinG
LSLHTAPAEIATILKPIWKQQPVVLIGSFLDLEASAPIYRQQLGIGEILSLKFSPTRHNEHINLYLPDRFPLPNTPEFRKALIEQSRILVNVSSQVNQPIVILIDDVPLKAQVGTVLAAEFGSRVKVEQTQLASDGILITGWEFWRSYQAQLPIPQLLIIATLPLSSLENPLVSSRVAYYKSQRQDWFRLYLLPSALRRIQQAILPLRESQGVLALLDNRVNYRSYGKTILTALEPCARINYIDPTWFKLAISD